MGKLSTNKFVQKIYEINLDMKNKMPIFALNQRRTIMIVRYVSSKVLNVFEYCVEKKIDWRVNMIADLADITFDIIEDFAEKWQGNAPHPFLKVGYKKIEDWRNHTTSCYPPQDTYMLYLDLKGEWVMDTLYAELVSAFHFWGKMNNHQILFTKDYIGFPFGAEINV